MSFLGELFIILLDLSYGATWIAFAVFLLRAVLKKSPIAQRLFLWLFVAIRLILPFYLPFNFISIVPNLTVVPLNITETEVPAIDTGLKAVNSIVNPIIEKNFTPVPGDNVNPMQVVITVGIVVWLVGVAAMLLYAVISWLMLRLRIKEATLLKENIFICDRIATPFVAGLLKPKIYLPSNLSNSDIECVTAHEKSHMKRGDHLWKLFGYLLLCIYWFNPVMWLAYKFFCKDIELACDAKAIKNTTPLYRKFYAQKLVAFSSKKQNVFACPLAFCETAVESRVKSVLNYKKPKLFFALVGVVICFSMSLVSFSANSAFTKYQNYSGDVSDELAVFIEKTLIERSHFREREGVEWFADFKVLDVKENNGATTVYLLARTYSYELKNGVVMIESSGVIYGEAAITVTKDAAGYELVELWTSGDGEMLWPSIKEKFPSYLWNYIMYNSGTHASELTKSCELQAQQKFLGKSAEECFVNDENEAVEIAKKICECQYDSVSAEYSQWGEQYHVEFLKNDAESPVARVWVSENGIASIMYWD